MSLISRIPKNIDTSHELIGDREYYMLNRAWNGASVRYNHCIPTSELSCLDLSCDSFKVVTLLGRVGGKLSPRRDPKKPLPMATQRPGFFFWIPPNVTYWSWAEKVRALRYLEVQFDLEQLERILGDELDFGRINRPSDPRHDNRITTCASLLANACLAGAEDRLYGDSLVAAFLAATHKELSREAVSNESGLVPWQLRLAKSYIEEYFRQDISLAELADLTHLSQSRFARGFRISTGVPPYSWALRRRIEAAEHLLASTDIPLSDIAVQVGFADQSHLTKAFRRSLGTTPAAWRRDQKR
jgi:AraC family transcriptional regulator